MKLLLTNDDGIDAPGLEALAASVKDLGQAVIVAPAEAHSGCSHRVTTDGPFRVADRSAGRFAVHGTPADCVRVALHEVVPEAMWVLAGINCGGNLGADVYHSGTVAAIREAALHGWPGIAVSQYRRRGQAVDWSQASNWLTPILADLLQRPWKPGIFWNINLPHLDADSPPPALVECPLDPMPLPLSFEREGELWQYNANYHQRQRTAGCDVDVCFSGRIAVTRLALF
jgi:5'-nucleotidase